MSYKSKLVANATSGEHHDVQVDSLSARKLIAWVDLLCLYWNEDDIRPVWRMRRSSIGPIAKTVSRRSRIGCGK